MPGPWLANSYQEPGNSTGSLPYTVHVVELARSVINPRHVEVRGIWVELRSIVA
jgi:hypothetical protein